MQQDELAVLESAQERDTKVINKTDLFIRLGTSFYPRSESNRPLADASFCNTPASIEIVSETSELIVEGFDGLPLVKGVNLMIGKSSTGKSTLVRALVEATNNEKNNFTFFEPTYSSITSVDKLIMLVYTYLNESLNNKGNVGEETPILFIDSIKALTYMMNTNLGKGGISMTLMQQLSDLSSVASQCNARILFTLNLTSNDDTVFENFVEGAKGSVANLLVLSTRGVVQSYTRDVITDERQERTHAVSKVSAFAKARTADGQEFDKVATNASKSWTDVLETFSFIKEAK